MEKERASERCKKSELEAWKTREIFRTGSTVDWNTKISEHSGVHGSAEKRTMKIRDGCK